MKDLRSSPTGAVQHRVVGVVGSKGFSTGLSPDLNKEGPTKNADICFNRKRNIDTQQILSPFSCFIPCICAASVVAQVDFHTLYCSGLILLMKEISPFWSYNFFTSKRLCSNENFLQPF